jgi:hypothetical protein
MGTSSSHRSPSTPEWERVKQLYRTPNPDPRVVASRITSALDAQTRQEMSGPGVACCLRTLLQASARVSDEGLGALLPPGGEAAPLLAASEAIREQAEREIARRGLASRFADIGLNALATAALEAGAGPSAELFTVDLASAEDGLASYAREGRLHGLALTFLGHDFDHLYRYFVTRDVSEFVGGPGLPTVAEASQLRDAVSQYCRETVTAVEAARHEKALTVALHLDDKESMGLVQEVLADLTDQGLTRIAAVGG